MQRSIPTTKRAIPAAPRALVGRPELCARLDAPGWRVATLSAPAGFGKTVLMASWAEGCPDPVAWCSCDALDAEPVRFWNGLIASLAATWPSVGDDAGLRLEAAGADDLEFATLLATDLEDIEGPAVIVIDDLHLARPTADAMAAFVAALPAGIRLVLGSRLPPPLPLSRLRLAGELVELRADDLRFAEAETATVLARHDATLAAADLGRLQALTEGWPAAVQLSATSLRQASDRGAFVDSLASTDRAVSDFLVGEVLGDLPARTSEFLDATCLLEEMDVDLCERITGFDDAGAVLAQMVDLGMLVVPVDGVGRSFRYHHLLGAFMQARLRASGTQRFQALGRRAAAALEERGLVVPAVRIALAVDDADLAVAMIRRSYERAMHPNHDEVNVAAARWWLHDRGQEAVRDDPILVIELVLPIVTTGGHEAMRWVRQVEAAHPDPDPVLRGYVQACWAEHHLVRGETDDARRSYEVGLAALGGVPPPGPSPAAHVPGRCAGPHGGR